MKKFKKKVIFFNPPLYFSQGEPFALDVSVPPLGLLYLASYINKNFADFKAEVIDVAAEDYSLAALRPVIKRKKPFIVGLTAMTPQLQGTVELARFLKKHFKKLPIVLGGPHLSADPGFLNRFKDIFDYGITGEAEKTLAELIAKLALGKKVARLQAGEVVSNLDTLPLPDRSLINREKYSQYESMMFSRGCPYQCYYCSRPAISKKIRYRSVKNLVKEIKKTYRYNHGWIDFQDDTFTLNEFRVLEFCQAVEKEGLKLNWRCNTRIDLVNQNLLTAMKKAGCSLIHFGIEAGNEKIRKEVVRKGQFTNQQIKKVIGWCQNLGIKFGGYFIIGHPGEGEKELAETKKMILDSGIDLLGLSIPTPFPGSTLYQIAKKRGIISKKIIDQFARKELGEGYVGNYPVFISEKVSQEYLYALMKKINRKFYLNFKTFWKKVKEDFLSPAKLKQDLRDLLSLINRGVSSRKPYVEKD